jgi:hypothetical protein
VVSFSIEITENCFWYVLFSSAKDIALNNMSTERCIQWTSYANLQVHQGSIFFIYPLPKAIQKRSFQIILMELKYVCRSYYWKLFFLVGLPPYLIWDMFAVTNPEGLLFYWTWLYFFEVQLLIFIAKDIRSQVIKRLHCCFYGLFDNLLCFPSTTVVHRSIPTCIYLRLLFSVLQGNMSMC